MPVFPVAGAATDMQAAVAGAAGVGEGAHLQLAGSSRGHAACTALCWGALNSGLSTG